VVVLAGAAGANAAPFVYINNQGSIDVAVIDTATNRVVATVPVASGPVAFGKFIGPGAGGVIG
jgi:YVTN family beta-propeller protein